MRFTPLLILLAALALIWSLFAPPEYGIPAQLGRHLGAFETEWIRAREQAAASQAKEIAEATAEVQRETYVTQKATDAEALVTQKQIQVVGETHFLHKWGAAAADVGCLLGHLGEVQGNQEAEKYKGLCGKSDDIRRAATEDYVDALEGNRTTVMEDMTRAFREAQRSE